MNSKGEKTLVSEYYENTQQFVDELYSIKVRSLKEQSDKKLIQKLKRWYKTYWKDGDMDLYQSQYIRIQNMLEEQRKVNK